MILLALLAPSIASAPAELKPVPVTIAALRADPKKYDGRVVRLTGYVNRCSPLDCAIAERPASDVGGLGQVLPIASDSKFDATIKELVPTYVELDARFAAACIIQVCSDRAPVLTVVSLRSVVSTEPPPFED